MAEAAPKSDCTNSPTHGQHVNGRLASCPAPTSCVRRLARRPGSKQILQETRVAKPSFCRCAGRGCQTSSKSTIWVEAEAFFDSITDADSPHFSQVLGKRPSFMA